MTTKMVLALLLGTASTFALAQSDQNKTIKPAANGYSQSGQGDVTRSEFGLCWRSGSWTPNDAIPGCDGPLKPPVDNPIAPDVVNSLEKNGAPAAKAPCDFSITLAGDQAFGFGKTTLTVAARQKLRSELNQKLSECQLIETITITGHSDPIGNATRNQELSEQRAANVAKILRGEQISAPINTEGLGSATPISDCPRTLSKSKRVACFAPDRRVEIVVHGPKK